MYIKKNSGKTSLRVTMMEIGGSKLFPEKENKFQIILWQTPDLKLWQRLRLLLHEAF